MGGVVPPVQFDLVGRRSACSLPGRRRRRKRERERERRRRRRRREGGGEKEEEVGDEGEDEDGGNIYATTKVKLQSSPYS